MNLPEYFIADLPPEAELTPQMVVEACRTLRRNRLQYLAERSSESLIRTVSSLCDNWLYDDFPFRKSALEKGPAHTGFSREMLARELTSFFSQFTRDRLLSLLQQELGHPERLDHPVASSPEQKTNRRSMVVGPELLAHIAGGVLPNPLITSAIFGLLIKSAQIIKAPRGQSFLPRLFLHSLYDQEPKLGACVEIAEWPGGNHALESALFSEIDALTVTGSDETIGHVRSRVPQRVRVTSYGHRLSFGYFCQESLAGYGADELVGLAADDVVAWDQLGCLSPHVFYVETGGAMPVEVFAQKLGAELEQRQSLTPRGNVDIETASTIAYRRSFYTVRAGSSVETRVFSSQDSTHWTVIYEADPRFQISCLNRFVYVKPVCNLTEALEGADAVRGKVSTVALAAPDERAAGLVAQLARWGVTRICLPGQMQNPSLLWRHDGRPPLSDLVTWTDWERD